MILLQPRHQALQRYSLQPGIARWGWGTAWGYALSEETPPGPGLPSGGEADTVPSGTRDRDVGVTCAKEGLGAGGAGVTGKPLGGLVFSDEGRVESYQAFIFLFYFTY